MATKTLLGLKFFGQYGQKELLADSFNLFRDIAVGASRRHQD